MYIYVLEYALNYCTHTAVSLLVLILVPSSLRSRGTIVAEFSKMVRHTMDRLLTFTLIPNSWAGKFKIRRQYHFVNVEIDISTSYLEVGLQFRLAVRDPTTWYEFLANSNLY